MYNIKIQNISEDLNIAPVKYFPKNYQINYEDPGRH